ncbi:MAG: Ig-like domain repeat protein, partial [Betaproteobacteria bacterium]|nr:Ig-like domain repeat protein [Betaproteobacteria bacterium]
LTATLTGTSPTGTVTFRDGSTTLATVPVTTGTASYTTNTLTEGVHRITAEYSGDGANNPEGSPVLVQTVGAFGLALQLRTGPTAFHTLAVRTDGTLLAWGGNQYGQLGDGTTTSRTLPVRVQGLPGGLSVLSTASGERNSYALMSDNTVWAWGYNGNGQLGNGTTSPSTPPNQVNVLTGVSAIAAGQYHALALKSDGTVWGWGYNGSGQLGNGNTTQQLAPVQVQGLPVVTGGAIAIAAGESSSYALMADNTVWAWGYNGYGQLGNGVTTGAANPAPVQVMGPSGTGFLTEVSAISAGRHHAVALKTDGTVWVWGYGVDGEVGDGISANRTTPSQAAITGVIAVAAGAYHVRAMKSDGSVWAWGWNAYGQLGDGTTASRSWPVVVAGLSNIVAFTEGDRFGFLMRNDGAIYALGFNADGELGIGTTTSASTPVQTYLGTSKIVVTTSGSPVATGASVTFTGTVTGANPGGTVTFMDGATPITCDTPPTLSAGVATCLKSGLADGVHTITAAYSGDANNDPSTSAPLLQLIGGLDPLLRVFAGQSAYHALAVKADGTLLSWGWNGYGQLGDGTTTNRSKAVRVDGITGVAKAAASERATIVLKSDGTVWVLGDLVGDNVARPVPAQVVGLSGITAVAAGDFHALALKSDGTVWAWGNNSNGQLGNNSTTARAVPVQVGGLSGVVAIAAGQDSSYAVKSDGTVWAWGYNGYGQLGDNTVTQRLLPVQVSGLTGVSAIAAGRRHAVALATGGTVWGWGYNSDGELGIGSATAPQLTPVQVSITDVAAIVAGSWHTRALKTDGTVWVWGWNGYGQLGDGGTGNRLSPFQITSVGTVSAIAGGADFGLMARNDGVVFAAGYNNEGELGNGTTNNGNNAVPVQAYLSDSQMALVSSANPANLGAGVTFTATLTGTSPTGTVTFRDGATTLATVPVTAGTASYTTNTLTEGVHRITAEYSGDGANSPEGSGVLIQTVGAFGLALKVAAGPTANHALAVTSDSTLLAWGANGYGQLGDGTTTSRSKAVRVDGISGVIAAAAAERASIAIVGGATVAQNTVWAWGDLVGDGTVRPVPAQVANLTGVTAIAAGQYHALALKSDGTVCEGCGGHGLPHRGGGDCRGAGLLLCADGGQHGVGVGLQRLRPVG